MKFRVLSILLILTLLLGACSRSEISVSSLQVQPSVESDGRMFLSLYAAIQAKDPDSLQMIVTDPSKELSWSLKARGVKMGNLTYYGSSDIYMPKGVNLKKGSWNVQYLSSDGQTVSLDFDVGYSDVEKALINYTQSGADKAYFDSETNLTVVPAY